MSEPVNDEVAKRTNEQSAILGNEFSSVFQEARKLRPDITRESVYESWAIQKIAGLHCVVFDLDARLRAVSEALRLMADDSEDQYSDD